VSNCVSKASLIVVVYIQKLFDIFSYTIKSLELLTFTFNTGKQGSQSLKCFFFVLEILACVFIFKSSHLNEEKNKSVTFVSYYGIVVFVISFD